MEAIFGRREEDDAFDPDLLPDPDKIARRRKKGDDDEDCWNWGIDIDFHISNESLDHQLDDYWGFLAHELQMTVRYHDFIFQASIIVLNNCD